LGKGLFRVKGVHGAVFLKAYVSPLGSADCVAVVARRFARLFRPPLEGVSSARYGLTHGAAGWTPFFMAQTSPQGP
jgi:hypothetical protein